MASLGTEPWRIMRHKRPRRIQGTSVFIFRLAGLKIDTLEVKQDPPGQSRKV